MKKKNKIILVSVIILIILIVLGSIIFINVNKNENNSIEDSVNNEKQITIDVYDKENNLIYDNTIETEKMYLADALESLDNLDVIMEDSEYGKYITSILGISQGDDYYWSYYINDEYASTGVSSCEIEDNSIYSFKIEKYEY